MTTHYIDPVNGLDTNGGTSWADAWQTLQHAFSAGDIIKAAKSVETAQPGTASATNGSNSVTGISGWTPAQYDIVRFDDDPTAYMVYSYASGTITLYRPYRGTTGSGKTIKLLSLAVFPAAHAWKPTSGTGTEANPITIKGGYNTSTEVQDGFTILDVNNNTSGLEGTLTYWNIERLGFYYSSHAWNANLTNSLVSDCFAFRGGTTSGAWAQVIADRFIAIDSYFGYPMTLNGCELNDLETADPNSPGFRLNGPFLNNIVRRWRNAGYSGQQALRLYGCQAINNKFIDCVLDELNSGCPNLSFETNCYVSGFIMENPSFGSGGHTVSTLGGSVGLSNINGDPESNQTFFGFGEVTKYYLVSSDFSTYKTTAPAAKVACYQAARPLTLTHYVPCESGVQKTISVYLRKNSSYGSDSLPKMRLRWITGTSPDLVSNEYEAEMTDVNDTWIQVSHAVTPSIKGVIVVELIFKSSNSGAIAWYDDFGVS